MNELKLFNEKELNNTKFYSKMVVNLISTNHFKNNSQTTYTANIFSWNLFIVHLATKRSTVSSTSPYESQLSSISKATIATTMVRFFTIQNRSYFLGSSKLKSGNFGWTDEQSLQPKCFRWNKNSECILTKIISWIKLVLI